MAVPENENGLREAPGIFTVKSIMKIGIIGGPYAGKTTLFQALAGGGDLPETYKGPSLATMKVPDERLDYLAGIYSPKRVVHAEVCFVDLAAPRSTEKPGVKGWDAEALAQLRNLDGLIGVVRAFESPQVPVPPEGLNPFREARELEVELQLADLIVAEKRLERLKKENAKGLEVGAISRSCDLLNQERSLRVGDWTAEEMKVLEGYKFLSLKPLLLVVNVSEEGYSGGTPSGAGTGLAELGDWASPQGLIPLELCCQLEKELSGLSPTEQQDFLKEWGLGELARDKVIQSCYRMLQLISFLTVGEDEVRAWPIPRGTPAVQAAGKIHSDIERGFIRAEVIGYQELRSLGSMAEAKKRGSLRLEGKDYLVHDGDIITFRFHV